MVFHAFYDTTVFIFYRISVFIRITIRKPVVVGISQRDRSKIFIRNGKSQICCRRIKGSTGPITPVARRIIDTRRKYPVYICYRDLGRFNKIIFAVDDFNDLVIRRLCIVP